MKTCEYITVVPYAVLAGGLKPMHKCTVLTHDGHHAIPVHQAITMRVECEALGEYEINESDEYLRVKWSDVWAPCESTPQQIPTAPVQLQEEGA